MSKINLLFVEVATIFLLYSLSFGQSIFFDDFDSYTVGGQLACQNPIDWIGIPCDPVVDPFISNTYSLSAPNSVVIVQNNEVIKLLGQVSSGKWEMQMHIYIPTGKAGYFNMLSSYPTNPQWAMEVYFDVGGGGRLENVPGAPIPFTWTENTWQMVKVIVDLDLDMAEFWINGVMINVWQWTQGGTINHQLDAQDFFGANLFEEMYFDDYWFGAWPLPVELISFTASVNNINEVILNWTTATEINNRMFEIERSAEKSKYVTIGYVNGHGTTTEYHDYTYLDNTVNKGIFFYRLKQIDFDGQYEYSNVIEVEVTAPGKFALSQNYPNPFNPGTIIKYQVPELSFVTLKVYDVLGKEITTLVNKEKPAGSYEVKFDGTGLPSGIYFYRLKAGSFVETKKMVLMK